MLTISKGYMDGIEIFLFFQVSILWGAYQFLLSMPSILLGTFYTKVQKSRKTFENKGFFGIFSLAAE